MVVPVQSVESSIIYIMYYILSIIYYVCVLPREALEQQFPAGAEGPAVPVPCARAAGAAPHSLAWLSWDLRPKQCPVPVTSFLARSWARLVPCSFSLQCIRGTAVSALSHPALKPLRFSAAQMQGQTFPYRGLYALGQKESNGMRLFCAAVVVPSV